MEFFASIAVARGSGRNISVTVLPIARLWVLRLSLAYTLALALNWKSLGIWVAMAPSNMITGTLGVL